MLFCLSFLGYPVQLSVNLNCSRLCTMCVRVFGGNSLCWFILSLGVSFFFFFLSLFFDSVLFFPMANKLLSGSCVVFVRIVPALWQQFSHSSFTSPSFLSLISIIICLITPLGLLTSCHCQKMCLVCLQVLLSIVLRYPSVWSAWDVDALIV